MKSKVKRVDNHANHLAKRNKRLRQEVQKTLWRDEWELEAVGRALTSVTNGDEEIMTETSMGGNDAVLSFEEALQIVSIWKARSESVEGIPHAVESTSALAEVYWRDQYRQKNPSSTSVTEIRLSYSSAIVRCINGLADMLQQQRFVAAPVSVLCGQLGIPSWLVDIRHEAAHNALPSLTTLRLGATALLDFLKSEYWIPMCPNLGNGAPTTTNESFEKPIDYLIKYKKTVAASGIAESQVQATKKSNQDASQKKKKKSKNGDSNRPFDMFFGDDDGFSSSDSEEEWEDPLLGNVWGSSIGTNTNRFAALEVQKKTPKKKGKKAKAPQRQRKPGEKIPIDYAKDFARKVTPQEGMPVAFQYLVWGGIGGAPVGRGILIPGSPVAFPASNQGITKCWQRYTPLLQILGKFWPGFCSALLVHLVDFILNVEMTAIEESEISAGSARKLFFLSAWVRMLVSEPFASKVNPVSNKKSANQKGSPAELPLASLDLLDKLNYPLNSLCDRCMGENTHAEIRTTSRDVAETFKQILGSKRIEGYGIPYLKSSWEADLTTTNQIFEGPSMPPDFKPSNVALGDDQSDNDNSFGETQQELTSPKVTTAGPKMSLDDIEAMLSDEEDSVSSERHQSNEIESGDNETKEIPSHTNITDPQNEKVGGIGSAKRQPWILCETWDPCSIGTLPGFPV